MSPVAGALIFAAFAVLLVNGQLTDCDGKSMNCQTTALNALTTNISATEKCTKVSESLTCMRNLSCVSDIMFRILFIKTRDILTNYNLTCPNLSDAFYPTSTDTCKTGKNNCLLAYVDKLFERNKTSTNATDLPSALCQDLSDYIQCLAAITSCTNNTTNLTAIKLAEETRSTKRTCTIHALQATLTLDDCSRGVSQCETIDDGVSATDLCPKTQTAVKCIMDLHCASDVILRLIQLQKLKILAGKTCDINSSFPLEKSTNACDVGVKGCLYPYVSTILSTNASTTLCSELNKFVGCKRGFTDTCKFTSSQLTTMGDNEKTRMRLGTTCSLNKGSFLSGVSAALLITTLLSTLAIFIKI